MRRKLRFFPFHSFSPVTQHAAGRNVRACRLCTCVDTCARVDELTRAIARVCLLVVFYIRRYALKPARAGPALRLLCQVVKCLSHMPYVILVRTMQPPLSNLPCRSLYYRFSVSQVPLAYVQ